VEFHFFKYPGTHFKRDFLSILVQIYEKTIYFPKIYNVSCWRHYEFNFTHSKLMTKSDFVYLNLGVGHGKNTLPFDLNNQLKIYTGQIVVFNWSNRVN
jgi:hypothetical protein